MHTPPLDPENGFSEEGVTRRTVLVGAALTVMGGLVGCTRDELPPAAQQRPGVAIPPKKPAQPTPQVKETGPAFILVPRSQWAKKEPDKRLLPIGAVERITLHHTGEYGRWATLPDDQVVLSIENYHRSNTPHKRSWGCIGYHYLVGRDGKVYEGRPAHLQGAHTSGANSKNLGISVIGDFMKAAPTGAQMRALAGFLADRQVFYKLPRTKVFGHRDLSDSLCPGDALYAWLSTWKAQPG